LPDITYNAMAYPFITSVVAFVYQGQSGAIQTAYANVFASLIKQQRLGQTAQTADWLFAPGSIAWIKGENILTSSDQSAMRSLKAPGTAYDDPVIGKDPQPARMSDYQNIADDNGGVHINAGIPSKAFYELAIRVGSEQAGEIWREALSALNPNSDFNALAEATYQAAGKLHGAGSDEQKAVGTAWDIVGITVP
jgi:Zn-dependent metalloprotease